MANDWFEKLDEDERKAWQERLVALRKKFEEGKVVISAEVARKTRASLLNVREMKDGSIDLGSVDGIVRSMARTFEFFEHRESLKKIVTLHEIQAEYVGFFREHFGQLFDESIEHNLSAHEAALSVSNDPDGIKVFEPQIQTVLDVVKKFWEEIGDIATIHLADKVGFKSAYGGDLFPSYQHNIVSAAGLYVDTIVLPDPFIRTEVIFARSPPQRKVYFLIKHAFGILKYEKLLLADVEPPIMAILPEHLGSADARRAFIGERAHEDSVKLAAKIFDRPFSSTEELEAFLADADDQQVIEQIKRPERILFDVDWEGSVAEQFKRSIEMAKADNIATATSVSGNLFQTLFGRMSQVNDVLFRSQGINATPIIDAPTSWQYFNWKLEIDAESASAVSNADLGPLHTIRGLQNAATGEMTWLGNIDPDVLIEMRKQGVLPELRDLLGKGIDEIAAANPSNFFRTSDGVIDNIHKAFEDHNKKIKELSEKKWKFAGKDIGLSLVHGTVELASAIGIPLVSLVNTFIDQTSGTPKYKEIPEQFKKLREESRKLKKSAAGLLFRLKRES